MATRPVRPGDITLMATRIGHAAQDMVLRTQHPGQDSPQFRRASRTYQRRIEALRRLAKALERQGAGNARLLGLIAEVADNVHRDRSMRLTGVQDFLHAHGIHGGQVDNNGRPVPPPHGSACHWCVVARADGGDPA